MQKSKVRSKNKILIFMLCILFASPVLGQAVAPDPTRLSMGARILGMGKAFVGLTDDLGALYTNPAGLGEIENWEMSSMSGTFMEDFNYLNLSGAYPTPIGVIGFGFTNSGITGGYATQVKAGSDPSDPIYEVDFSQPQIGYYNNVLLISYGNKLEKTRLPFRLPMETLIGTNLKLFYSGMYGDGITQGNANGYELDLGILLKPKPWFSFGSTVQNILPASMGGKLTYSSGHTESYPAIWENGICLRLLGGENSLRQFRGQDLKFLLDMDYYPSRTGFPALLHYGIEWFPMKMIAIRAGIDQDASGDGLGQNLEAISNLTAGVGLYVGGFSFDYAYHQFAGAPGITNNFVSLSFAPTLRTGPKLRITNPKDKSTTFADKVKVAGEVLDPNLRDLKLNGIPVKIGLKGDFSVTMDLKPGKNKISVSCLDPGSGNFVEDQIKILRLKAFPDVSADYWVAEPISLLAMANIISGYPNGSFKPEGGINRAEICSLLIKARERVTHDALRVTFKDVPKNHWAAKYVAQAAELGIVKGYPDGSFQPKKKISRAEGLAMITRFAGIPELEYANQFPDVPADHWSAKIISGAHSAGILEYLKGKTFKIKKELTRAETVEMLYRTQFVQNLLDKDLLNWEVY